MCFAGRIQKNNSIFKYTESATFEGFDKKEFEPLFLQEVVSNMTNEMRTLVNEKCKGNNECIFDYAITGKYVVIGVDNVHVV